MSATPTERLAAEVMEGKQRAVARAIRLVDDRTAGFQHLVGALAAQGNGAWVVGITGNPGAGKSTLVDQLVQRYRAEGKRVAVLAIDPTSPFSGGAILGDRIRMQRHFLDEGVFIRSLATRGQVGGLSRSTVDALVVLDAAGYDVVIVETVGVGQDELDIAKLAHTTCVLSAPGLGDDVQAIKAGILEVADILVVNKADRPGADAAVRNLQMMIALGTDAARAGADTFGHHGAPRPSLQGEQSDAHETDWVPPVLQTTAHRGDGLDALLEAIERHRQFFGHSTGKRRERAKQQIYAIVQDEVWARLGASVEAAVSDRLDAVAEEGRNPYLAAEEIVEELLGKAHRSRKKT